MSREEVFEKLNEVFRDVFDDEEITVSDATTADDIEEWDSLEHINLLAGCFHEECGRNGGYHSCADWIGSERIIWKKWTGKGKPFWYGAFLPFWCLAL